MHSNYKDIESGEWDTGEPITDNDDVENIKLNKFTENSKETTTNNIDREVDWKL